VNVAGYKKIMITKVPRKTQGAVELEVRLEPDDSSAVATAGVGSIDTRMWIVLIGFFLLFVIVKAARTSGRLLTTKR
jgi:hypothetical protein